MSATGEPGGTTAGVSTRTKEACGTRRVWNGKAIPLEQAPPHVPLEPAPDEGAVELSWDAASPPRQTIGHTAASNPVNKNVTTAMMRAIRRKSCYLKALGKEPASAR